MKTVIAFLIGLIVCLGGTRPGFCGGPTASGQILSAGLKPNFITMSCGSNCTFTAGSTNPIGTALYNGGSIPAGMSWSIQTSGNDVNHVSCVNYGSNFAIDPASGVVTPNASAAAGANAGVCIAANANSPLVSSVVFNPTSGSIADNATPPAQIATLTINLTGGGTYMGSLVTNGSPGANQFGITACGSFTVAACPYGITGNTGAWNIAKTASGTIADQTTTVTVTAN